MTFKDKNKAFFFSRFPIRALAESSVISLGILVFFRILGESLSVTAIGLGWFFMVAICGGWASVRLKHHLLTFEAGFASLLTLGFILFTYIPVKVFSWERLWSMVILIGRPNEMIYAFIAPVFLLARLSFAALAKWNVMRRQRLRWALAHGHLLFAAVVMGLVAFVVLIFFNVIPNSETATTWRWDIGGMVSYFLVKIFPLVIYSVFFCFTLILIILPPIALLSSLMAKKTIKRLENLTNTARYFAEGNYNVRAEVTGEDEASLLQKQFNSMAASLQDAMEKLEEEKEKVFLLASEQRELTAAVSHDLRTPIAVIRGHLENLSIHAPQAGLTTIKSEILHLQSMVDDLFTLSRAKVNRLSLRPENISLNLLVGEVVNSFTPLAKERNHIELAASIPHDLPILTVDPKRLKQILSNLLANALRHTPPGGIVQISAREEDMWICIDVCDSGQGIPEEDLSRIWDKYYRGKSPDQSDSNAGLGLSVVRELTELMGGRATAQNSEWGAQFSIHLPMAEK